MKQQILWVVEVRDNKAHEWVPAYMRMDRLGARMTQFYNARPRWKFTRIVKYIREA